MSFLKKILRIKEPDLTLADPLAPKPPGLNADQSRELTRRVEASLYPELEKMGLAQHIHALGAKTDPATHQPYVFIHFPKGLKLDLASLPQISDGVEVRYEKAGGPLQLGRH